MATSLEMGFWNLHAQQFFKQYSQTKFIEQARLTDISLLSGADGKPLFVEGR